MVRKGGRVSADADAVEFQPYVPADQRLAEITIKAVVLGILLSVILASANVYLGLFAGITVSASIPAAVISMGVLRLFRNRNILENNIVQTATSAGESLAAGVIFTVPALVILGTWESFSAHAWETILIAVFAGVLGVVFTVPLRRAFIVDAKLQFPEGIACAEVLEAGESGGHGVKIIALGATLAALTKLLSGGFQFWKETADWAGRAGTALFGAGSNLSAALVAVGYIVGTNISIVIFSGGVITWLIAMPIYTTTVGLPVACVGSGSLYAEAGCLWSTQLRYMGVGAMAVGGLYALVRLAGPLSRGMRSGIEAYQHMKRTGEDTRVRTERDLPVGLLLAFTAVAIVALFFVYAFFAQSVPRALVLALVMLVFGFLFSSVAGYMAGLVGSSNNPISGVTIAATLVAGSVLVLLGISDEIGPITTIAAAATIATAGAIAGDNMQDLKTGYLLGATPRNQQTAQLIGVTAAALSIPFILEVMRQSYGFCTGVADRPDCLAAPQANLIGSVAGAFFGTSIPWGLAGVGALIALGIIMFDLFLESRGAAFRMPVLAAAIGIYLPIELTTAIFVGGLIHFAVKRFHARRERLYPDRTTRRALGLRNGLLLASGLIAGEAIMGILLGVTRLPAVAQLIVGPSVLLEPGQNPLSVFAAGPQGYPWGGIVVLAFVVYLLYYVGTRPFRTVADEYDEGATE